MEWVIQSVSNVAAEWLLLLELLRQTVYSKYEKGKEKHSLNLLEWCHSPNYIIYINILLPWCANWLVWIADQLSSLLALCFWIAQLILASVTVIWVELLTCFFKTVNLKMRQGMSSYLWVSSPTPTLWIFWKIWLK